MSDARTILNGSFEYDQKKSLSELAVSNPSASRIFHQHGLDYCCGGRKPLEDACAEKGLNAVEILSLIHDAEAEDERESIDWKERNLSELVDFIVERYHQALRRELPELIALASKVERRHSSNPLCPKGLSDLLRKVQEAVLDHLAKEEQVLFPMIKGGKGASASAPVRVMEFEHREHAENLQRIRSITQELKVPQNACTSWKALYLRLDTLEAELMEHIHLENNVLFPRALYEQ